MEFSEVRDLLSIPLTLALLKTSEKLFLHLLIQAVVQIQKLAVEVFEFVPLLDAKKVFHFFWGGAKVSGIDNIFLYISNAPRQTDFGAFGAVTLARTSLIFLSQNKLRKNKKRKNKQVKRYFSR